MNNRDYAVKLARHYFEQLAENAAMQWDLDNDAEIEIMIDAIIDAAIDKIEEINK